MAAKATISPGYRWRLGGITLVALAVACWFFYDGVIGYPATQKRQIEMKQTYDRLHEQHPANYNERWLEVAKQRGWPTDQPGEPKTDTDIAAQYLYGMVCVLVAVPFGFIFVRSFGRWVASDPQGLSTSWGQQAPWATLKSMDTSRWKTKGIAKVHYQDQAGADRVLTLDDWKFEREPVETMFNEVRDHLGMEASDTMSPPPPSSSQTQTPA